MKKTEQIGLKLEEALAKWLARVVKRRGGTRQEFILELLRRERERELQMQAQAG